MNYMSEIAKMLGIELREEFMCNEKTYYLSQTGLFEVREDSHCGYDDYTLVNILTGTLAIQRKSWKPNEYEIFWRIDAFGNPVLDKWTGHSRQVACYNLGNCYRTEADAKKYRDKWVAFYASDTDKADGSQSTKEDMPHWSYGEDDADCWCE